MEARKLGIAILILVGIITASFVIAGYNFSHENSQTIFNKNVIHHTVTKETPFFGVGSEYIVQDGIVTALFNDTTVYADENNDGIYGPKYILQAGQTMNIPSQYPGSRIFANKPIICKKQMYDVDPFYWYDYVYSFIPPIEALEKEYYISAGTWYFSSPENTTVYIDENVDGSIDGEINITFKQISYSISSISKIYADKPFCIYNSHPPTFIGSVGKDFYTPASKVKLVVIYNSTTISFDYNNDGVYDEEFTKDKEVYDFSCNAGAHINADKQILAYFICPSYTSDYYYLPPSDMMGNDIYVPSSHYYYYMKHHVIGCFSNTTVYGDNFHHDLIPEWNHTMDANEDWQTSLSLLHIWGNKPFLAYQHYYDGGCSPIGGCAYSIEHYPTMPYSYIHAIVLHEPNEIGVNDDVNMEIRVFNTFDETYVNNVSVGVSIDDAFSLSGGSYLTMDVEKRWLRNDTVVSSSHFNVYPSHIGNEYTFTLSKSNSNIFSCLEPMEYYSIKYTIISPSIPMICKFKPVQLEYDASTWILPS